MNQLIAVHALTIFTAILSASAWAQDMSEIRPSWATRPAFAMEPNSSMMSDVRTNADRDLYQQTQNQLIDHKDGLRLMQVYDERCRSYEDKQRFGLTTYLDEQDHLRAMGDMSNDVVNSVRSHQATVVRDDIMAGAQRGEVARPIILSSTIASVYMGNPVDVTLIPGTRLSGRADVRNQQGELKLSTPALDGAFNFDAGAGAADPTRLAAFDPNASREQYRVTLSRGFPELGDLSSNLSYGTTTTTVHAAISKPITRHVTSVLEAYAPTRSGMASAPEQDVKVLYGFSF